MLQRIRKHVHGWMAWVFLFCIAVVFIFWGSVGLRLGTGRSIDVNGKKLSQQQIESFKQIFPRADLVQITAGIQALESAGFNISKDQLDATIKTMPDFQVDGKFSPELFSRLLKYNPQQLEMIETGTRYNSLVEQMSFGLQQAQADFPSSTARYYKLMDQKRNVGALSIESKKFLDSVTVDNKELTAYYNQHKNKFVEQDKVKLEYIKLNYSDIVKNIHPSDQEIEEFYNNNSDQFVTPGKKRISQIVITNTNPDSKEKLDLILKQLEADKNNFGALAEKNSEDFLTAKQKGDSGWFQAGDMHDKALDEAITSLNNIGDVSQVITKGDKSYLFRLTANEQKSKLSLADARADIITRVSNEKANTVYADLKDQLERKSFEVADNLETVAEELKLTTQKTQWLSKDAKAKAQTTPIAPNSPEQELLTNQKVIAAAFSEDVLENRNNSNVIELSPEAAVVVRIAEYKPQRTKELTEVTDELTAVLKANKSKAEAKKLANKLWADFANAANTAQDKSNNLALLEKLSQNNSAVKYYAPSEVSYVDTFWDNKTTGTFSKEELKAAFVLPRPTEQYPVSAKLLELANGDQVIIAINKVTFGEYDKANAEQKLQSANQLKYFMIMRDSANFFNRISKDSKVVAS